ncbi:MAG TPA: hypothetical protein VK675_03280 [Candidatus Paceibacterota bacterium]|nr:hypothetical protein [Candidatus Paceibacterota bacterium]
MTLEKLRKEFPFGDLSCNSCGGDIFVYIKTSGKLLASVHTKITWNGNLEVVEINPVAFRKKSQSLIRIAKREKIPLEILTRIILKQIADW